MAYRYSQKLENLLVVSLESSIRERLTSDDLSAGVDESGERWEIIVKYYARSEEEFVNLITANYPGSEVTALLCNYAIIVTSHDNINLIANEPLVEYIEKPKILYFDLINEKRESCIPSGAAITPVYSAQERIEGLSGRGVITAVIDTGIDVSDRAFRNNDGTTRLIRLWDQQSGRVYDDMDINDELAMSNNTAIYGDNQALFYDYSNHGINVCKIACGNDGVAYGSDIIFVKLRRSDDGFTNTTDMMRAVDYCIRTAAELGMPVAVNISYGSNYGPHLFDDIQTAYINDVSRVWKSIICVGSGNEAQASIHAYVEIAQAETKTVELAVRDYEQSINFAIWFSALDDIDVTLVSPGNVSYAIPNESMRVHRTRLADTQVITYTGEPKPYSEAREVYVGLNGDDYVTTGLWKLIFKGNYIKNGSFNIWMASAVTLNQGTGFLRPSVELTFTIPSTADSVITVGAYNSATMTPAAFSGRGYAVETGYAAITKPDISAPGENVYVDSTNVVTGTSFAVPFVTGSAALLMEWGIVNGNDAYMYGDKLKAALKKGAVQLPGQPIQSSVTGWGRLCLRNSIPR